MKEFNKDVMKEEIDKTTDEVLAEGIVHTAFLTFGKEDFSYYEFNRIAFIQLMALHNEGMINDERLDRVDKIVGKRMDSLMNGFINDLVSKKKDKRWGRK